MQKPQRSVLVDLPEAERPGEKAMAGVEVQGVEINVGDLARPVGHVLHVRVVGARAHEGEVAPVRIPATEAVAAAVGGEPRWRGDRPARRRYRVVKCVDAVAVGHIEYDAHEPWPRSPMQADDMMIGRRPAIQPDAGARFHRLQGPDALVESPCFLEVRDHELHAADTAHPTLLHRRHPSGRARAARESECGEKPASKSCAACERSGDTLASGAVQPRPNPQCSCGLPCAQSPSAPSCHRRPELGKLGPALRRGWGRGHSRPCRPRWAMDKYYGLIAMLVVVLGICRGVRLGLSAPAMRAQVHTSSRRYRLNPLPPERRSRAGKSLRRRSR